MPGRSRTPLLLYHAADAEALLRHAAAEFLVGGRAPEPLPLIAVRQGGVRDDLVSLAAEAGCDGWLGEPVVVFRELLELLSGDVAPLSMFEREALLRRVTRETRLEELGGIRHLRGFLVAVDELLGRMHAARISPETLAAVLSDGAHCGSWEEGRDRDLIRLYARWRTELSVLPPRNGLARVDGRDMAALAAAAVRGRPEEVARRVRRPFRGADERRPLGLYGLADLGGGWRDLIAALVESQIFSEVRVHLLVADPGSAMVEPLSERAVLDELRQLAQAVERLEPSPRPESLARIREGLFTEAEAEGPSASAAVSFVAAPDLTRELGVVAREVKRRVIEEGAEPSSIAIVVRGLRPEGPRAVQELLRHGVPVTARLRYRLTEVPAVAALLRVFRLAAEGWSRRALIELAESPYFDLWLDAGVLGLIAGRARPGTLDEWRAELERALAEARETEGEEERERRGPSAERIGTALLRFRDFAAGAKPLEGARARSAWLALALDLLGAGDVPGEVRPGLWHFAWRASRALSATEEADLLRVDAARLDARALDVVREAIAAWAEAERLDEDGDRELDAAEWLEELTAVLAEGELAAWTPHRHGVQVLEALAAVGRTFDHVYLVGLSAADFPSEPTRQPLFGDAEVERLRAAGLPLEPASEWLAREASLFRAVATAPRQTLHLGYTYADAGGAPVLPSQYLEECAALIAPPDPEKLIARLAGSRLFPEEPESLWAVDDALLHGAGRWGLDPAGAATVLKEASRIQPAVLSRALHGARVEHVRAANRREGAPRGERLHAYNGLIEDPELVAWLKRRYGEAVWSASRLETYGFCPFRFFGTRVLRLAPTEDADEDMDALTRGTVLHTVLERVQRDLSRLHGTDALGTSALAAVEPLLDRHLRDVLEETAARGWTGAGELTGATEASLRRAALRYLRWEIEENEKNWRDRPRRQPVHFEWSFGWDEERGPAVLKLQGRELRLRGRIDRVDEVVDGPGRGRRYVVDHKSGEAAFTGLGAKRDAGALLQLELYLHALEAHGEAGAGVWGGAYQVIGGPSRRSPLHLYSIAKDRLKEDNKAQVQARGRLEAALRHALDHVDGITGGRFPAAIPGGCQCPGFCELREVCREDRLPRRES